MKNVLFKNELQNSLYIYHLDFECSLKKPDNIKKVN